MASYTISHTDGTTYTILGEGVADTSLGISLIGQNFHNYGQLMANNFLQLLENQSSPTQPLNPQQGQLWWNSAKKVLSVFDGNKFKPCSSSTVNDSTPSKPLNGDQWWDTTTNQLKVFDDTEGWLIIGPIYQKGQLFTGLQPDTVTDKNGALHSIARLVIDGEDIAVLSKDPRFDLPTGHEIHDISAIHPGISLTPTTIVAGTATNANNLGGIPAAEHVTTSAPLTTMNGDLTIAGPTGLTIGTGASWMSLKKTPAGDFTTTGVYGNLTVAAGTASITCNHANGEITISNEPTVDKSVTTKFYVDRISAINENNLRSYVDTKVLSATGGSSVTNSDLLAALGNDLNYSTNVNAWLNLKAPILNPVFTGTPRAPTPDDNDSSTRIATTEFVRNLLTPLNGSTGSIITGDIVPSINNAFNVGSPTYRFKTLYGHATSADYADLAEIYSTDAVYRPGTVVVFGGTAEITVSDQLCDSRIAGVISTNPAYLMNDSVRGQAVALTGKVPCKVVGPVKKGDILVNSKFSGVATVLPAGSWIPGCTIGKSLEDNSGENIRDVMIAVGRF